MDSKTSWSFIFSFSANLSDQEYNQPLLNEMTTIMDTRNVFKEEDTLHSRINYIYNGISPEDALKYIYRVSTRPEGVKHLAVKIYNIKGNPYVQS